jgi:hypothetical protein
MSTASLTNRTSSRRLLRHVTLALGGLGLLKFLGLFFEVGAADAPWGFLIVWVPPFAVAWVLLRRPQPRAGAILAVVLAILVLAVLAQALIQGLQPAWTDYLLVIVGAPLAMAAIGLSFRVLRGG